VKKQDSSSGQSLIEFAIILPLIMALLLGVIEVGYGLLDQHVVTKLAREGSNLISRNTTLTAAGEVMKSMGTRPVNFNAGGGSKVIFSVIKKGTVGTPNGGRDIVYQRHEVGTLSKASRLTTTGGSWPASTDYTATNADTNTGLRVTWPTGVAANLVSANGFVYVTEIWTTHTLITPFDRFGIRVPSHLYSIAYF
jgi:Flp pilus assembly protein TadG